MNFAIVRENFASDETGNGSVGRTSRCAVTKFRYGSTRSSSSRMGTAMASASAVTAAASTTRVRRLMRTFLPIV